MTHAPSPSISESIRLAFSYSRFAAVHLVCLAAIYTGVSVRDLWLCLALYAVRMFAVTGGYHRYFSHRSYKVGRVTQLLLAVLAQSSGQKGVLWWASMHRHHHRYSDQPEDIHSPRRGVWWSHVGWILHPSTRETRHSLVKDLARFPELVWLDRHPYTPAILLAATCLAVGGWGALVVGFFWSTVLLYHATFTINSLSHIFGSQRYDTGDDSRNNWMLALLTFGEGWHNNHHHYQSSARQGFFPWELDITYGVLVCLEKVGIVQGLRSPPAHVLSPTTRLPHPGSEEDGLSPQPLRVEPGSVAP